MKWYQAFKRGRAALPVALTLLTLATVVSLGGEARAAANVRICDAWLRSTPTDSTVGAACARLHNESGRALLISSVSSDVSSSAELHEMSMRDGVMRMRHLEKALSLKAGETVELAPGGMHLMLFGLRQSIGAGDSVLRRFQLSDGSGISIAVPIRDGRP